MTNTKFGRVATYPDRKEDDTIREIHSGVQVKCTSNTFFST